MAREHESAGSDSYSSDDEPIGRREYLLGTGAGVATAFLGLSRTPRMVAADAGSSPEDSPEWNLSVDEQFEGTTLDPDLWDSGFGWGMSADFEGAPDDALVVEDNISVEDGRLVLEIEHGGGGSDDVTQGAINSKDRQSFSPGKYVEARMKLPGRTGILPAFWSMPADESWPPEIDVVELFQQGDDPEYESKTAWSNVHYAESPNDASTHEEAGPWGHNEGKDLTETFNTYGCAWLDDRIEFYFNGTLVQRYDDSEGMEKVNAGAPFYLMFSNHVNRLGTPDYSEPWRETMEIEWCRVWEYDPESDSDTTDEEGSTDETTDTGSTAPNVDRVALQDRSNPAWARVRAEWTVSDSDGDLSEVTTELRRVRDDALLDSKSSNVSGSGATGKHNLRSRNKSKDAYYVKISVTDADGNTTSETR